MENYEDFYTKSLETPSFIQVNSFFKINTLIYSAKIQKKVSSQYKSTLCTCKIYKTFNQKQELDYLNTVKMRIFFFLSMHCSKAM